MVSSLSCHFVNDKIIYIKRLRANDQCVYIVEVQLYQIVPAKAVIKFDRPVNALSMHVHKFLAKNQQKVITTSNSFVAMSNVSIL